MLPWGITDGFDPSRNVGEETVTLNHSVTLVRYIGQQMYVHQSLPSAQPPAKVPASGPQPSTKPWMEVLANWPRRSGTAIAVSPDFGQESVNPAALLGLLKSVGTVTDEGPASGPGWTGTKYGFSVTAAKEIAGARGPIDVDSQGQVRRAGDAHLRGRRRSALHLRGRRYRQRLRRTGEGDRAAPVRSPSSSRGASRVEVAEGKADAPEY